MWGFGSFTHTLKILYVLYRQCRKEKLERNIKKQQKVTPNPKKMAKKSKKFEIYRKKLKKKNRNISRKSKKKLKKSKKKRIFKSKKVSSIKKNMVKYFLESTKNFNFLFEYFLFKFLAWFSIREDTLKKYFTIFFLFFLIELNFLDLKIHFFLDISCFFLDFSIFFHFV